MNKETFFQSVLGKSIDLEPLSRAYRCFEQITHDVNTPTHIDEALASSMFRILDAFDRNGDPYSIDSNLSLQMAECIVKILCNRVDDSDPELLWYRVSSFGANSIKARQECHWHTIECRGVGIYYGDHSQFDAIGESSGSVEVKNATATSLLPLGWAVTGIDYRHADATGPYNQKTLLRESSCIGWVLENTKNAYCFAGMRERWSEIMETVQRADVTGDALCRELQQDHWIAIRFKADSDPQERKGEMYEGIKIDHVIGDYALPGSQSRLREIAKSMFLVGMFNRGSHTFVGSHGDISEFHWTHLPTQSAIETTPLQVRGGDGLLMLPPGSLDWLIT
jgi:hypothetical protein